MASEYIPDLIPINGPTRLTYLGRGQVKVEPLRTGPTERQLEWMRKNIPHFADCERQARAARGRQG